MLSLKLLTTRWNFLFFCYQLHIFRRVDHIDTAGRSPMLWFTSSYPLPCWKWHSMNSCWPIVTGMQPIKSKIIQRVVKHKNIHCILNETVHQKCMQWMTCQRQVRLVTCWNEVQISQAFHLELRDWCDFFTCNRSSIDNCKETCRVCTKSWILAKKSGNLQTTVLSISFEVDVPTEKVGGSLLS